MALWSPQRGELPARSVGAAGPCSSSLDLLHLSASWLLFFVQSTVKRKKKKQTKKPQKYFEGLSQHKFDNSSPDTE